MCQSKSNKFYHEIQHTQGKSQYILNWNTGEPTKIGHFQTSKSIFGEKFSLCHPENDYCFRISNQKNKFQLKCF